VSDLHTLPLRPHDLTRRPEVRAKVFRSKPVFTGKSYWWWRYDEPHLPKKQHLRHGPFTTWREAYDSAYRMVESL
jgi:hypothetical protein